MLAVDVSNWLRPGAATSPGRLFCHVYRRGKGNAQMIPGWPYFVVAALEPGRTSWTAVLDAVRPPGPARYLRRSQRSSGQNRACAAGAPRPGPTLAAVKHLRRLLLGDRRLRLCRSERAEFVTGEPGENLPADG